MVDDIRQLAYRPALDPPVVQDLLTALLRRCDPARPGAALPDTVVRRFRLRVEEHLADATRVSVDEYAAELGYGPRTLTRAVRAATGVSAKTWLDQRTVLEAQRLLAHTDLGVAACGRRLGFVDAANFSAFSTRCTGTTPGRWRLGQRLTR